MRAPEGGSRERPPTPGCPGASCARLRAPCAALRWGTTAALHRPLCGASGQARGLCEQEAAHRNCCTLWSAAPDRHVPVARRGREPGVGLSEDTGCRELPGTSTMPALDRQSRSGPQTPESSTPSSGATPLVLLLNLNSSTKAGKNRKTHYYKLKPQFT